MLLCSTQDVKKYVGSIQKSTSWDTLKTYVSLAENFSIKPIIGQALYNALDVVDFTSLSSELKTLLEYVQRALAYATVLRGLPELYATISDTGVQQQNPENSTPANQWVVSGLKESFTQSADDCINSLIQFLDDNATDYTDWENTAFVQKRSNLLIKSANELSDHIYFPNSHYAFWKMYAFFGIAERKHLTPSISEELLQEFKDATTPTAKEKKAIQKAKDALAHFAFYEAIPALQFKIVGGSLLITTYSDGIAVKSNDYKILKDLKEKTFQDAQGFLVELKSYLDENSDDFPTYKASIRYQEPENRTTSYGTADNSNTIISI
ncbi:hypothetical protein AD998_07625 [bacterium 336/3]|nr:hypothetical protein AD998_07625 [bacterium 336/3]